MTAIVTLSEDERPSIAEVENALAAFLFEARVQVS
jgi:hypothetical protein